MVKKGILERLSSGVVIGDGGFVMALEKRGYVKAGPWTAEASAEHPEAVKQLHREFLRAGSDVMQTFTFYTSEDKLAVGNNIFSCREINNSACKIAHEVANEGDALVAGSITQCPSYQKGQGKKSQVQAQMREQLKVMVENKVDFIIAEFFHYVEEIEWAVEEAVKTGLVVAATMAIGEKGDRAGVPLGQCAVRMAKAGAKIVGVNCMFDLDSTLNNIKTMKDAMDAEGLSPFLMTQPNGFHCPGIGKEGYMACPEFPFAMETRTVTRFDVHKYARKAYELGVRYIGGCCGFEAYHIRAIAEELKEERGGKLPPASMKHEPWGYGQKNSHILYLRDRVGKEYWSNLVPNSGRVQPPSHDYYPMRNGV